METWRSEVRLDRVGGNDGGTGSKADRAARNCCNFFLPNIIHSLLLRSNLYSESRLEFDIAKLHLEEVN